MAQLDFDTRTAPPPREDFDVLPTGEYLAILVASEKKPTNKNDGFYLDCTFQIIGDGPAKGRNAWTRLNLWNTSEKAVEIANKDLNAICAAVGHVGPLPDSTLLHNKPLIIRTRVLPAGSKRRDGTVLSRDQSEIAAFKAVSGGTSVSNPPTAAPTGTPATGTSPWGTKAA